VAEQPRAVVCGHVEQKNGVTRVCVLAKNHRGYHFFVEVSKPASTASPGDGSRPAAEETTREECGGGPP